MQTYGLLVRSIDTQPESFPTCACIGFTGHAAGSSDFHPGDWVRVQPAMRDLAVTLESGDICVAGLPTRETTQLTLLERMPGANGLSLKQSTTLAVETPDRMPLLVDGATIASTPAPRKTAWLPPGPEFFHIRVLDAAGHSAKLSLRIVVSETRN